MSSTVWPRLLLTAALTLLVSVGCRSGLIWMGDDDTTDDDDTTTGDDDVADDDSADDDSADDDDTTDDPFEDAVCGFETGDLSAFGHPGDDWWVSPEGGIVAVKAEGEAFSGLLGEEMIPFSGMFAAVLRSSEDADPDTAGHLLTDPFVPVVPWLIVDQLSEVDDRGIALEVAVLDEYGDVLEEAELPVETGGFVPGLPQGSEPIEEFPEIVEGGGVPGEFVRQLLDLTPYWEDGETIQVRFRQHTRIEGRGFFTLLDNVCNLDPYDPRPHDGRPGDARAAGMEDDR